MRQAYWKWPESAWRAPEIDGKQAKHITAGVDIGTTSSQAVILCDGSLFAYANIITQPNYAETATTVLQRALGDSGLTQDDLAGIVATGWGAAHVLAAGQTVNEVQCHAKGARFMFGPSVTTVVDLGGQTTKSIRLFEWDRIRDFTVGDKCATGMGRNIEMMAEVLQIPITEFGEKSLDVVKDPEPVSTTCSVFADTETIGLLRPGYREELYGESEMLASYLFAIVWRILGSLGKLQSLDTGDITVYKELAFTGGLAKNVGITQRLERELKTTALTSEYDPQLAGAIGAALFAAEAL
jgi:predicted CoA-substrate-specific enzyme activase